MLFYEYETKFASPRIEPELYINSVVIRVYAYDNHDNRFLVGVLAADKIAIDCAINDDVSLYEVFDSDEWEFLYVHLFDENGDELEELGLQSQIDQVVIIYRAFFSKCLKRHAVAVLQALEDYFSDGTLLAIWDTKTAFSKRALVDAGFEKLGGLNVVVKHGATVSPYRQDGRNEKYFDVKPTAEDQSQVEAMWNEWKHRCPSE